MNQRICDNLIAAEDKAWEAVRKAQDVVVKRGCEIEDARLRGRLAVERAEELETEAEAATVAREEAEIAMARKEGTRAKA